MVTVISYRRLNVLMWISIYIVGYCLLSYFIVSPKFAYLGYYFDNFKIFRFSYFCLLAILPATWLPTTFESASDILYWVIYILVIVPSILVPSFRGFDINGNYVVYIHVLLSCFLGIYLLYKTLVINIGFVSLRKSHFLFVVTTLYLVLNVVLIRKFGITLEMPNYFELYFVRDEFAATSNQFMKYAIAWLMVLINPILLIWGLKDRKIYAIIASVIGQFYVFSLTAHKTAVGSILLILVGYIFLKKYREDFVHRIGYLLVLWLAIVLIVSAVANTYIVWSLAFRRLLMTQGLNSFYYFDYFTNNEFLYLKQSILSFLSDVDIIHPAKVIAGKYFDNPDFGHANVNFFAEAFANFGYIGMYIYSIILGVIMIAIKSISMRKNKFICTIAFLIVGYKVCQTSLLTTISTHGLGLILLVSVFFPQNDEF